MVTVEEAYLPMTLFVPNLSDDKFQEFCEQYADFRLEYTSEGDLIIMPPTDEDTGFRNSMIIAALVNWNKLSGRGRVGDSSTGYRLRNGSRRSPDAAWISPKRHVERECPEFIIELLSPSDRRTIARAKMQEWIDNGAELGWMIDPAKRTVTVFRPNREPQDHPNADFITGEGPVAGFALDLREIWAI